MGMGMRNEVGAETNISAGRWRCAPIHVPVPVNEFEINEGRASGKGTCSLIA